jgi:hypothetical protein
MSMSRAVIRPFRAAYAFTDRLLRSALGERALRPYRPPAELDKSAMLRRVYRDFSREQPSQLQEYLLLMYLHSKHAVAKPLRAVLRRARGA